MSSTPLKDNAHSWSVSLFETHRPLLTSFLKERILPLLDAAECRRILIRAPVKSGKREMVEYLAVRDQAHNPLRVHAFVSSFHRVADEEQRKELKIHNMEIFSLTSRPHAEAALRWIAQQIASEKQIVLHIDECDFGAGERQILSQVYREIRAKPQVSTILYSATPQEVLFSGEVDDEEYQAIFDDFIGSGEWIEYAPPETFCGPQKFLEADLVKEARPFFQKTADGLRLTDQGKEIVTALRESRDGRNILVLRLSYSDLGGSRAARKENKAIYQFLQGWETISELADCLVIADKSEKDMPSSVRNVSVEKINWSDKNYWRAKTKEIPLILVVDQTSSRSTEWACHDRVLAYHDFRNTIVFSTISQAQERVNHYATRYGSFQKIKVFGHLKTFQLSAGTISYDQYLHYDWEMRKVDRRTAESEEAVYQIRSTSASHDPHPRFPTPLPLDQAERALQELGCYAEIKVSPRVRGGIRNVKIYEALFFPCTKETFEGVKQANLTAYGRNFQNPFVESERKGLAGGKYKGYLREWKVFNFEADVLTQPGWGVNPDEPRLTICYRGSQLGVAVRYDTGLRDTVNSLTAFRSMYKQ
jgi:hypothetical protein